MTKSQINLAAFTAFVNMTLSEKVETKPGSGDFKFQKIKDVKIPVPLLSDFGIDDAEQAKDDKGQPEFTEDGVPVYSIEAYDWLQTAIVAKVFAQSRNKFNKGELKEGNKLCTTFAELAALGERNGEALKARHDAKKAFAAYLEAGNKKPGVVKVLSDLFGDPNSIAYAKDNYITALEAHLPVFAGTLSEVDKARYANTLNKIAEALDNKSATLDDDMGVSPTVAVAA